MLHNIGVNHRDIKPSNILINENCEAKLCDFGLARFNEESKEEEPNTEYVATRWYRAPELNLGSVNYDKSVDIWGLGCLIVEMFTGKPLFPGSSTLNQLERILAWTGIPSEV